MRQETVRRYAPFGVALLVLVVIGVVWGALRLVDPPGEGVGGSGSGSGEPPVIALTGWATPVTGEPDPRYRLADGADLPDGPAAVAAHGVVAADAGPLRDALNDVAADGGRSLVVEDSGHWTLGAVGCAVASPALPNADNADTAATVATDCATRAPRATDPQQALDLVRPVFAAVGLDPPDAPLTDPGVPASFSVDPAVGGLPTLGLTTRLDVWGGTVGSGDGWVVRTPAGAEYPVLTAREAYDRLVRTPLPMPLMACPEPLPPDANPLPCGGPVTVTGARLGLSLQQTSDGPLLVPSWLFQVEGSAQQLVQVAVQPRYLAPAGDGGSGSGGGSSGGGSGGGSSGGTGTAVPPSTGSAPPSAGPGEPVPDPVSRFTAVTRGADDRRLDVTFWGGVKACYSYDVRVVEDARRVRLYLVEKRAAGDKPCIDLAEQKHLTVALGRPLGQRTVEDGDSGQVLLGPAR